MTIFVDGSLFEGELGLEATLGDALTAVQDRLPGRVVVKVMLDEEEIVGTGLQVSRGVQLAGRRLTVGTEEQKELSLKIIGRLAALIQWLTPRHKEVAGLLEKGQSAEALKVLASVLSAWQQIQQSYGNLAKLNGITLKELSVRELTGEAVMEEFCRQLSEIHTALENRDFVLLADILQYEMDAAVANWNSVLEATLAVVDPSLLAA